VSRTPAWVAPAAVVVAIALVVAAFFVVRWYTTPVPPKPLTQDTTAAVISQITGLPASEFNAVGQGTANNLIKPVKGTALTGATGKPEVLYIGAEYCPYCAAERWALIVALGRFGTFSGLQTTTSSSTDIYPNTPTFTFRGATYTSDFAVGLVGFVLEIIQRLFTRRSAGRLVRWELESILIRIRRLRDVHQALTGDFLLPTDEWARQRAALVHSRSFDKVVTAYREVDRVNDQWAWRKDMAKGGLIAVNLEGDGLDELEAAVKDASDSLGAFVP